MKQASLPLSLNVKKTRKAEFLAQMERVVPWAELVALIAPYYPEGKNGRLRISAHGGQRFSLKADTISS